MTLNNLINSRVLRKGSPMGSGTAMSTISLW